MKVFSIRFDPDDKALIDIATVSPEPVEAFAFTPSRGGTVEVSTVSNERFERWVKALRSRQKKYEIVSQ